MLTSVGAGLDLTERRGPGHTLRGAAATGANGQRHRTTNGRSLNRQAHVAHGFMVDGGPGASGEAQCTATCPLAMVGHGQDVDSGRPFAECKQQSPCVEHDDLAGRCW